MRTTLVIAALALLQTPSTALLDTSHFQSMREVHVEQGKNALACAVLPPSLFHEAAPALRDIRLTEDGREIPFAQEESYDEHSLANGVTAPSDRSIFDTVADIETTSDNNAQVARFHLPARIPVERVSLSAPAIHDLPVLVTARISTNPQMTESIHGIIHTGESAFPVTLGANLQQDADVEITLPQQSQPTHLRLEMRRRWICFQPSQPNAQLRLHYGDTSLTGPNYRFASAFIMPVSPEAATIGPRRNKIQLGKPNSRLSAARRRTLLIALGAIIMLLPLLAIGILTKQMRIR